MKDQKNCDMRRVIIFIIVCVVAFLGAFVSLSIYADNGSCQYPSERRNCCKMPTYKRGETVTDCLICDESLDFEGEEDSHCPF